MVTTAKHLREESFVITQNDPGTSRDIAPGYNLEEWQDLWRYQVEVGRAFVFTGKHRFSLYLEYLSDAVDLALADDGTVFTDETTPANEATADDITLMPATEAANDAYYFGYRFPFTKLRVKYTTAGTSTAKDAVWQYYNGSAWATIPGVVDSTTGFTVTATTTNISFTPPADWARTTVDGKDAYWIRWIIVTADYSVVPIGDQVWINYGEVTDRELFRIEVRDPSEEQRYRLFDTARYGSVKEFQDVDKMFKLPVNEPIVAKERYWIVVQAMPRGGVLDVSTGYFRLESLRMRKGIWA